MAMPRMPDANASLYVARLPSMDARRMTEMLSASNPPRLWVRGRKLMTLDLDSAAVNQASTLRKWIDPIAVTVVHAQ